MMLSALNGVANLLKCGRGLCVAGKVKIYKIITNNKYSIDSKFKISNLHFLGPIKIKFKLIQNLEYFEEESATNMANGDEHSRRMQRNARL